MSTVQPSSQTPFQVIRPLTKGEKRSIAVITPAFVLGVIVAVGSAFALYCAFHNIHPGFFSSLSNHLSLTKIGVGGCALATTLLAIAVSGTGILIHRVYRDKKLFNMNKDQIDSSTSSPRTIEDKTTKRKLWVVVQSTFKRNQEKRTYTLYQSFFSAQSPLFQSSSLFECCKPKPFEDPTIAGTVTLSSDDFV